MLVNKKTLFQAFAILASALSAKAQEASAPDDSAVVKLTSETFEDFIKENPVVLAEFFAPWCGHCKTLAPHYVEAAAALESEDIALAQIDCTVEQDLCMKQGIRGYPSLKLFKNHDLENPKDYAGGRTANAIITYMKKQILPTVQVVDSQKDLEAILTKATQPVIFSNGDAALNETFFSIADKFSEEYTFVSFPGSKVKLAVQLPSEAEAIEYNGDITEVEKNPEILESWLKVEALPYFGEITGESFGSYVESDVPLAYFFYTDDDEFEEYTEFFTDLAKEHRGKINFVGLDSRKFGKHAENLNMDEQFPLFAIHNMSSNLKYGLPQLAKEEFEKLTEAVKLETKDISKLVDEFLSGKSEAIIKSEEVPEVQESNVIKIVGKSHDGIAYDEEKDVLVKYYAPWCGHCKRLAPIYEELADILASDEDSKDKFVIAEVDSTLNDIQDVEIEGFPTIVLYPAGKNAEPVVFSSQRELTNFITFLEENAGNKVDFQIIHDSYKSALEAQKVADDLDEVEEDEDFEHDEL